MRARNLIAGTALGASIFTGAVAIGTWTSLEDDRKYTDKIESTVRSAEDYAGNIRNAKNVALDTPENISKGPERNAFQRYCEGVAQIFYDVEEDHASFLAERESEAMVFAFKTGKIREYRQIIEDVARGDDGRMFEEFLEFEEKFQTNEFNDVLERRLLEDNFYFSRLNGRKYNRVLAVNNKRDEITARVLKIIGRTEPAFAVNEAATRIARGGDSRSYMLTIGHVGGNNAINYIMQHFDENGLKNSYNLVNAARTREQAQRVYSFIWSKIDEWQGSCKEVVYAVADLKKIGREFSIGVPPVPYCPQ